MMCLPYTRSVCAAPGWGVWVVVGILDTIMTMMDYCTIHIFPKANMQWLKRVLEHISKMHDEPYNISGKF